MSRPVNTSTTCRRAEPTAPPTAVSSTTCRRAETTAPPMAVTSTTCRRAEPTAPPMAVTSTCRRTGPTARPMAVTSTCRRTETTSTQNAGVQNRNLSSISMLSNIATYQSAQYTASQNSCYSLPETTCSNGSAYPDAPPLYNEIYYAAVQPELFSPPPSYEEAVSYSTNLTSRT